MGIKSLVSASQEWTVNDIRVWISSKLGEHILNKFLRLLEALLSIVVLFSTLSLQADAWSNGDGGYSQNPLAPKYGTHDWIAEHALDWLPQNEKESIINNLGTYLYGTELPDTINSEDGIGDSAEHHIYFNPDRSLADDSAAVRAQEEYDRILVLLELGESEKALKTLGTMTHYIADVSVFGHVMDC